MTFLNLILETLLRYLYPILLTVGGLLAFILFIRFFRSKDYHITLIVLELDLNRHYEERVKSLYDKNKIQEYEIKPDKLGEIPRKVTDYIRGIRKRYLQINWKDKYDEPESYKPSHVQPKILKIVKDSKALEKVGDKEFSEAWSLPNKRKIFMAVIVIVIGYFIYMYMTGGITF